MTSQEDKDKRRANRRERRRELRKAATDAESRLWHLLRGRQLGGWKFRRQHQVGQYVLDFYCHEHQLAVEADGGQHLTPEGRARDEERTLFLSSKGIRVIRFTNLEILLEAEAVQESILQSLKGEPSP